jgi:Mrp family chromosome partitioning ATPase/capsular polysaccharide biosynthesis protein
MVRQATVQVSTLRDYVQVVRRRKWIIAQAVVIVPLAALAFSLHQQKMFQGSAQVLLSQQDLGAQLLGQSTYTNDPADRQVDTQASLARVPRVAQLAVDRAHSKLTPQQLLASSSVSAGTNSDLLTFSVTNHDPGTAEALATAYAHAYVAYRLAVDTAPINTALTEVNTQIAKIAHTGSLYNNLEDKATQLQTLAALKTANASVVQSATKSVQTVPRTRRNVILGVLLGLVLGVGLAFLREALDTRIRTAETISEGLHLPLLARLPEPPKQLRTDDRLAMLSDPSGVQAEAFRMLRTNVEFAALDKDARIVMVTSATEREGKSTTIANLAVAMARGGKRVVLVDLDLRRPFIDRFFDLGERPGITQVAIGMAPLGQAAANIPLSGHDAMVMPMQNGYGGHDDAHQVLGSGNGRYHGRLDVLPAGPIPPDPGEFVGTERLSEILDHLKNHSDIVLVDAPPLFHVGDGLVLSSKVDAVLVVTNVEKMRRGMLGELHRLLDTMPAAKLGFVVTGAEGEESYGYGYGGYYYYEPYERRQKAVSRS